MSIKVFGQIFDWVFCFLIVESKEFLVYFGYQYFIRYVFCKYFLYSVGGLISFTVYSREQKIILIIFNLPYFFLLQMMFLVFYLKKIIAKLKVTEIFYCAIL